MAVAAILIFLAALVLLVSLLCFSLLTAVLARDLLKDLPKDKRGGSRAAPKEGDEERGRAEEEARRSREMEEGFDNLMRFSVNGKDGFGP